MELARPLADRVVVARRGRGAQLNVAARAASHDLLMFVHVDTELPPDAFDAARAALARPGVVGGAFQVAIRDPRRRYRVIEWGANLRARVTRLQWGDQAVFTSRAVGLLNSAASPEDAIPEDVAFARRLALGRVALLPQQVRNSPRRWEREGLVYATVRNWVITLLYAAGVPAARLARWYPAVR
ncbi:MAG: glycosyltransferase [Deltaproteobacteria bacterium]|nr:glycosyltransferase [Deltaproteobacteria bacterium]